MSLVIIKNGARQCVARGETEKYPATPNNYGLVLAPKRNYLWQISYYKETGNI